MTQIFQNYEDMTTSHDLYRADCKEIFKEVVKNVMQVGADRSARILQLYRAANKGECAAMDALLIALSGCRMAEIVRRADEKDI